MISTLIGFICAIREREPSKAPAAVSAAETEDNNMGLWDALSGKIYKQNKYSGDNTAYFLQRLISHSDGFERHWCQACLMATKVLVEELLFNELKLKGKRGRQEDANPFHKHLDVLTPEGARELFRYSVAHRLGMFLKAEQHLEILREIELPIESFKAKVTDVFELDEDHMEVYGDAIDASEDTHFSAIRSMYARMLARAYQIKPTMDIASITLLAQLLNASARVFGQAINRPPSV